MELVVNELEVEDIPENKNVKKPISYDDILSKMNMFVSNGRLHLLDNKQTSIQNSPPILTKTDNSYIYNKYFKDELKEQPQTIRRPKTLQEYKLMVLQDYLQRQKIKQIKSTKLIMPTNNIGMAYGNTHNLDKLFMMSRK